MMTCSRWLVLVCAGWLRSRPSQRLLPWWEQTLRATSGCFRLCGCCATAQTRPASRWAKHALDAFNFELSRHCIENFQHEWCACCTVVCVMLRMVNTVTAQRFGHCGCLTCPWTCHVQCASNRKHFHFPHSVNRPARPVTLTCVEGHAC